MTRGSMLDAGDSCPVARGSLLVGRAPVRKSSLSGGVNEGMRGGICWIEGFSWWLGLVDRNYLSN